MPRRQRSAAKHESTFGDTMHHRLSATDTRRGPRDGVTTGDTGGGNHAEGDGHRDDVGASIAVSVHLELLTMRLMGPAAS